MESSALVISPRRGRLWSATAMALLAATSLTACGLAGEDLFGGRTTPSEGQGGAGSGGAPAGSGGETAAESVAASAAQSAASTAQSAAQSVSSAAQSVASSAEASSSTGNPGGVVVWCAGAPCQGGEVCCFHLQDPNLDNCGDAGRCGGGFIELSCSGPGDCPGAQVCCGDWQNFYTDISCQPACDAPDVTLCTGDPGACGAGQFCDASGSLGAGYDVCKN
jgi:hypothetical protein